VALTRFVYQNLSVASEDTFLRLGWLIMPLIDGLTHGNDRINANATCPHIGPNGAKWPILFWVCQWRLLMVKLGWYGGDVMVAMVLATPGINVNQIIDNKTNAGFFAVKYGAPGTLQMLIDSGLDMQQ
jgi:hypothetical protein